MTSTFEPKNPTRLLPIALDIFIKRQRNLSKHPPKLWPRDPKPKPPITNHPHDHLRQREIPALDLAHPYLRKLNSCLSIGQFNQVHSQLVVSGLSQHSLVTSQVVKKLCALGSVPHAVWFFARVEEADAFLCNTVMRGFMNAGDSSRAIKFYFDEMVGKSIDPNYYTFPVVIKCCVEIGSSVEGEKVHGRTIKLGFEPDLFVRNSLIHLYSSFGKVGCARKVFDSGFVLDSVSWASMIDGHAKNGELSVARELFDEMPDRDVVSWNAMISGYAGAGDMQKAKYLFDRMPFKNVVSWNCMIDGFARVGNVLMAREFFNQMPTPNLVSWNIMLALYVRSKDYAECLRLFDRMQRGEEGIKPNEATLVSVFTACSNMGDLDKGISVHTYIKNIGIRPDVLLSTALLTMYIKCGALEPAEEVFDEMLDRNTVTWNSMIMGYGNHGRAEEALKLFSEMEKKGPMPNDNTFTCVLSACAHAGLVFEGLYYFNKMSRVYEIEPKVEHFGCLVDLLARAGLMKESEELIKKMPTEDAWPALWVALLSACKSHSNLGLGEAVAKRLIELDPTDIEPYVLLSNIYAEECNWDGVESIRMMMKEKNLQKDAGASVIHVESPNSESS
ncbi:hypothetical protein CDL15_Pgr011874 [Punica granatum]|uniref:Pentatricopeptide repeat-containing protein At3g29230-like n=1 Tax=Punica granatum TaxID=22663 RepID=A0A218XFS7_PUNGR|nr:hypothetical protein CDL15_Pgr011874 [Punica granatum]PKI58705.1 hypothetical protein CRG98_020901 [Punica granatum]